VLTAQVVILKHGYKKSHKDTDDCHTCIDYNQRR